MWLSSTDITLPHLPRALLLVKMLLFILLTVASAQRPPFWGPTWHAEFAQSITLDYLWVFNNTVNWYYDSTTTPVGSSLYKHGQGQIDEMCTSVKGREKYNGPCDLLASTDGWRRISFPDTGECCKACNLSDYCGIVSPNWLQDNSTYQGSKIIGGKTCEGWLKVVSSALSPPPLLSCSSCCCTSFSPKMYTKLQFTGRRAQLLVC